MPLDTRPDAGAVQREVLSRLTGAERLRVAFELSEATRRLALAGLKRRMAEPGEPELVRALIKLCYGRDDPRGDDR